MVDQKSQIKTPENQSLVSENAKHQQHQVSVNEGIWKQPEPHSVLGEMQGGADSQEINGLFFLWKLNAIGSSVPLQGFYICPHEGIFFKAVKARNDLIVCHTHCR